jgi:Ca2+-binding EF-hand superfamily protein
MESFGKGMSADEVLEDINFKQEHWLYTYIVDTTGLRSLLIAVERENKRRENKDYIHSCPAIQRFEQRPRFEGTVAFVIVCNCVTIGLQASATLDQKDQYETVENMFLIFFLGEIVIRVAANGWPWFFVTTNFFDSALVIVPAFSGWVLRPLGYENEYVRKLQVLRILRIIRLVRMIRSIPFFREMWIMMRGLIECGRTLFWTYVMILAVLFLFGVVAVDVIAKDEAFVHDDAVQDLFGTLDRAMFTLTQIMTLDSWTFIARPMMAKVWWVVAYYVALILLICMVLLNLITAVIVENAFQIVHEDEETIAAEKAKQMEEDIKDFSRLFADLTKGSGSLTYPEFKEAAQTNTEVIDKLTVLEIEFNELEELWELLDDGDGVVTVDEFCEGLRKVRGEVKAKELMECIRQMRKMHNRTSKQRRRCQLALEAGETMLDSVTRSRQKMADTILLCRQTLEKVRGCKDWSALVPHLKFEEHY